MPPTRPWAARPLCRLHDAAQPAGPCVATAWCACASRTPRLRSCAARMMRQLLAVLLCIVSVVEPAAPRASIRPAACNATLKNGCSIGGNAYKQLKGEGAAACCAACVADTKCAGFVISNTGNGECLLKADLSNPHAKSSNDCAAVRGSPTPMPPPQPLRHRRHPLPQARRSGSWCL